MEPRTLLSIAAFTVNLYEDSGGGPGELISDDTVAVDSTFFIEILAREYDPLISGLRGVALDIAWDPTVLREVDSSFQPSDPASPLVTESFPLLRGGALNDDAGTIDNLSGYAFLSAGAGRAIGNVVPERFALLRFQALSPANASPLSMRQGRTSIVTVPVLNLGDEDLYFEPQTITIVPGEDAPHVGTPDVAAVEIDTHFVGPLTAEIYFKTLPPQLPMQSQPAVLSQVAETHECWPSEIINAMTAVAKPSKATAALSDASPAQSVTQVQVHAPVVQASVTLHKTASATSHPAPQVVDGAMDVVDRRTSASSDGFAAAVDAVLASDEPVGLLDRFEKNLNDDTESWFAPL